MPILQKGKWITEVESLLEIPKPTGAYEIFLAEIKKQYPYINDPSAYYVDNICHYKPELIDKLFR